VVIGAHAGEIEERLRHGEPAVIGRIADGKMLLDLRSIMPHEDGALTAAIARARA
jgi:L-seryl-tRNA(Ser) seleniumtransferase